MKTHLKFCRRLVVAAVLIAGLVTVAACSDSVGASAGSGQEREETAPVPEQVLQRSKDRWKLIVDAVENKERWIEVYQYLTPSMRKSFPITAYLPSKTKFHYGEPTEPKLLKIDGNKAYLSVRATWLAYLNPDVRRVEGGEELVKPFQSIEEWHWVDGEWFLERPHRENDFHRENPGFFSQKPK